MVTKNDITGDSLVSKKTNEKFRDNYDLIFGKPKKEEVKLKDRVKLGISPSASVETWDCRGTKE